jgi:hypothetical protein
MVWFLMIGIVNYDVEYAGSNNEWERIWYNAVMEAIC